mmetsp:Transcript_17820/g.44572  ORF Transcript_17820/g.44572 Transcript_17820/m.44572 type:complete len:150 (-) Transcript_17820:449-898(-)
MLMHKAIALISLMVTPTALAKSRRAKIGRADTIRGTCVNPVTSEAEYASRVEYGDKLSIKLSAYHENPEAEGGLEYSMDVAEQEIVVGRANVPVLNELTIGMCKSEIRRLLTWLDPKQKAGPLAYMVELVDIVRKKALQLSNEAGHDEL